MKINSLIEERLKTNKQVIIVSAHSLSEEEMGLIKKDIPLLGSVEVKNEVDKKIMAGIIIKIGSLIIDQSLSTKIKKYLQHIYENN